MKTTYKVFYDELTAKRSIEVEVYSNGKCEAEQRVKMEVQKWLKYNCNNPHVITGIEKVNEILTINL